MSERTFTEALPSAATRETLVITDFAILPAAPPANTDTPSHTAVFAISLRSPSLNPTSDDALSVTPTSRLDIAAPAVPKAIAAAVPLVPHVNGAAIDATIPPMADVTALTILPPKFCESLYFATH